jgi:hypothetical protein
MGSRWGSAQAAEGEGQGRVMRVALPRKARWGESWSPGLGWRARGPKEPLLLLLLLLLPRHPRSCRLTLSLMVASKRCRCRVRVPPCFCWSLQLPLSGRATARRPLQCGEEGVMAAVPGGRQTSGRASALTFVVDELALFLVD